jgi:hypothetical protein
LKKACLILGVWLAVVPELASAQYMPSMTCRFGRFIQIKHVEPAELAQVPTDQSMTIIDGRTDPATLALDGTKRATNSRTWYPMLSHGWETWESMYLGDFREILSLKHGLGANLKPLKGRYEATLTDPGADETGIFVGACEVR